MVNADGFNTFALVAGALIRLSKCVEIEIVGFHTRFIPASTLSEAEAEIVDDPERNFVLDRKDIRQLLVESFGPY
jgi:hypothetical protein